MKSVIYTVTLDEKAKRSELIIRFFWLIITVFVAGILNTIGGVLILLQSAYILFYKKKHKGIQNLIMIIIAYNVKALSYLGMLTEERSPVIPETK